jgi:hypothetical protein
MALEHQDEKQTVAAKREPRGAPEGQGPDSPATSGAPPRRTR